MPDGLSLCGRHVWSWLAGVLAWRNHLSIIDFPPFYSCLSCFSRHLSVISSSLSLLLISSLQCSLLLLVQLFSLLPSTSSRSSMLVFFHSFLTLVLFVPLPPCSQIPLLSPSPLSLTLCPFFFVYITPDHQVRLAKYRQKNERKLSGLSSPWTAPPLTEASSLLVSVSCY